MCYLANRSAHETKSTKLIGRNAMRRPGHMDSPPKWTKDLPPKSAIHFGRGLFTQVRSCILSIEGKCISLYSWMFAYTLFCFPSLWTHVHKHAIQTKRKLRCRSPMPTNQTSRTTNKHIKKKRTLAGFNCYDCWVPERGAFARNGDIWCYYFVVVVVVGRLMAHWPFFWVFFATFWVFL